MTVEERIKLGRVIDLATNNVKLANQINLTIKNSINSQTGSLNNTLRKEKNMPRNKGDYYIQESEYMELLENMETMDEDEYEERKSQLWPSFRKKLEEDEQEFADDACGPFWNADGGD